jgi:Zn-dependent protease with chaperone function
MKDFFERQDTARKRSIHLFIFFVLAIVLIVFCVYMVVTGIFFLSFDYYYDPGTNPAFWKLNRFAIISAIALFVILCGSLYKINELKGGGYRVAEMLGGRRIFSGTGNPEERRLLNVVEEMSIASGIPVPAVYVMDREGGINAFASGYSIDDSVISVTKGSISTLKRDELQAVIAHEFSHIFNGDTLINIRLLGWLHGILLISLIGQGILRGMSRVRGRGSLPAATLGIALFVLGYVGVFFGKLIKSAVSRQREYLADASAVQFTRNPSGLAGALKKIRGLSLGSQISHTRASEASHMYFCEGLGKSWFALMETHPPLIDRILKLEPFFNGKFPVVKTVSVAEPTPSSQAKPAPKPAEHLTRIFTGAAAMGILSTIGAPMKEHAELARKLLNTLPAPLMDATRDSFGSCALIYFLLLDQNEDIREKQLNALRTSGSNGVVAEVERLAEYSSSLEQRGRLPLVDLAIPSLRALSPQQYRTFKNNINTLVDADEKLSLFEYILRNVLIRRLDASFVKPKKKVIQIYSVRGVIWECSCVLSMIARSGHEDNEKAAAAFARGQRLLRGPKFELNFLSSDECTPVSLEKALNKLDGTSQLIKRKLLAACLDCLTFDKTVKVEEAELFRAIADVLGCPVPPWLSHEEK